MYLLTEKSRQIVSRYFSSCSGCGLPIVDYWESVCPVCGSTSWGWKNLSKTVLASLALIGFFVGEIFRDALPGLLGGGTHTVFALLLGLLTFLGSTVQWKSRRSGEKHELPLTLRCIFSLILPAVLMFTPVVHIPGDFVFQYFGLLWVFLGYDWFLYRTQKSPSLNRVLQAIEEKQDRLEKSLAGMNVELAKLKHETKTPLISEVTTKLSESTKLIEKEIPNLAADQIYTVCLKTFFYWKNSLYNIFKGINNIHASDLDAFEEINEGLETEILGIRQGIKDAIARGRPTAREIDDYIERSLPLHRKLKEALTARRASHLLSEVELLKNYDVPERGTPLIIEGLDCTSEILDKVNSGYFKIKLDSDVNELLRPPPFTSMPENPSPDEAERHIPHPEKETNRS